MEKYKKEYLEYLEVEKNCALKTIENYDRYLSIFLKWAKITKPSQVTDKLVHDFRLYLGRRTDQNGDFINVKTKNYYIIALRNLLKFLAKNGISSLAPERLELAKTKDRSIDFLEIKEIVELFKASQGESLQSLRNQAILELLFASGMRVSELVNLDRDKINLTKKEFSIMGKGSKIGRAHV